MYNVYSKKQPVKPNSVTQPCIYKDINTFLHTSAIVLSYFIKQDEMNTALFCIFLSKPFYLNKCSKER